MSFNICTNCRVEKKINVLLTAGDDHIRSALCGWWNPRYNYRDWLAAERLCWAFSSTLIQRSPFECRYRLPGVNSWLLELWRSRSILYWQELAATQASCLLEISKRWSRKGKHLINMRAEGLLQECPLHSTGVLGSMACSCESSRRLEEITGFFHTGQIFICMYVPNLQLGGTPAGFTRDDQERLACSTWWDWLGAIPCQEQYLTAQS